MAQLPSVFDPSTAEQRQSFDLLPAGKYLAEIVESRIDESKSGNGMIISLTWVIKDGAANGRRLWQRINFLHANEQAQRIGQSELRQITDALGLGPISDTDALEFKPLLISVGVEVDKTGRYGDKNIVKGVAPSTATPAQARPASQPAASTAQPAALPAGGAGRRPWDRKTA